ncbi:Uncharacterised protein [Yokenella regensburgei]|nr:Uncharacterised protein [Yokenella regensburgei]
MFTEEKTSWEREMLIREAIENAEQGFTRNFEKRESHYRCAR